MSFLRLRETMSAAAPAYLALSCFGFAAYPAAAQDSGEQSARTVLGGVTENDTATDADGYTVDRPSSPKFTQTLRGRPPTRRQERGEGKGSAVPGTLVWQR